MDRNVKHRIYAIVFTVALSAIAICVIALIFFRLDVLIGIFKAGLSILEPFFYGLVIAFLLRPLAAKIEHFLSRKMDRQGKRRKRIRLLSIAFSLIILLLVLVLLIIAVVPEIIKSLSSIIAQIPGMIRGFSAWLENLDHGGFSHELVVAAQNMAATVSNYISNFLKGDLLPELKAFVATLTTSIGGVIGVVGNFVLGSIISAYIMGNWDKFLGQTKLIVYALLPQKAADWVKEEAHIINHMFSGFVRGKLLDSAIIGILCFLFTIVTGMPYAVLISVIVGVTNMIPFFGPYIGAIPSAILVFTVSRKMCVVFVIFIIILQQLDGNVIGPRILGNKVGLSGFWILFSILVFGSLWGVVGMLIGVPVFAVIYDLIRRGIYYLLRRKNRTDLVEAYQQKLE